VFVYVIHFCIILFTNYKYIIDNYFLLHIVRKRLKINGFAYLPHMYCVFTYKLQSTWYNILCLGHGVRADRLSLRSSISFIDKQHNFRNYNIIYVVDVGHGRLRHPNTHTHTHTHTHAGSHAIFIMIIIIYYTVDQHAILSINIQI